MHTSQKVHTGGAYTGFQHEASLGVLLLPTGWDAGRDASPSQGYPQQYVLQ